MNFLSLLNIEVVQNMDQFVQRKQTSLALEVTYTRPPSLSRKQWMLYASGWRAVSMPLFEI